jgi:nitroimidazol reductase NimA-like FMN-containing flavoprotein (pyridoxamine 5'-phosphate oxidase superfamily)
MTGAERDAFLAGVHVAVLSVTDPGRGPLTVPVWYSYDPGGLVTVLTGRSSRKAALLAAAGRCSLCAQTETPPYQYVSVEGPVVATDAPVDAAERRAIAHRYLGEELGDGYLAATAADAADELALRIRPERWYAVDFAQMFD